MEPRRTAAWWCCSASEEKFRCVEHECDETCSCACLGVPEHTLCVVLGAQLHAINWTCALHHQRSIADKKLTASKVARVPPEQLAIRRRRHALVARARLHPKHIV